MLAHCDAGISGVLTMQIGASVPPTHLLTKHPFPPKRDFNSPTVKIFFLYYYLMGQYPALYDLSTGRNEV